MFKNIKKLINSKVGKIIVSIILGLGLASLFKIQCKDKECLEYTSPDLDEINKNVYKYDDKCYKFEPNIIKCKNIKSIRIS